MFSVLSKEELVYKKNIDQFIREGDGKYVVIQDDKCLSFFDTEFDALKAGYSQFNAQKPFLLRKVSSVENLHYFSPSPLHYGLDN
jgi:hypothetical protein